MQVVSWRKLESYQLRIIKLDCGDIWDAIYFITLGFFGFVKLHNSCCLAVIVSIDQCSAPAHGYKEIVPSTLRTCSSKCWTAFSPPHVVCSIVPTFLCWPKPKPSFPLPHMVPSCSIDLWHSLVLIWDFLQQPSFARLCSPMWGKFRLFSSALDLFRITVVFKPLDLVFQIPGGCEEFVQA